MKDTLYRAGSRLSPTVVGLGFSAYFYLLEDQRYAGTFLLILMVPVLASTVGRSGSDVWAFTAFRRALKLLVLCALPLTLVCSCLGYIYLSQVVGQEGDGWFIWITTSATSIVLLCSFWLSEYWKLKENHSNLFFLSVIPLLQVIILIYFLIFDNPETIGSSLTLIFASSLIVLVVNFAGARASISRLALRTEIEDLTTRQLLLANLNGLVSALAANAPILLMGLRDIESVSYIRIATRIVYMATFGVALKNLRTLRMKFGDRDEKGPGHFLAYDVLFLVAAAAGMILIGFSRNTSPTSAVIEGLALALASFGASLGNSQYDLSLRGKTGPVALLNASSLISAILVTELVASLISFRPELYALMSGVYLFGFYMMSHKYKLVVMRANS